MGLSLALADEGRVYLIGRGEACAAPPAGSGRLARARPGGAARWVVLVQDLGGKNRAALAESWLAQDRTSSAPFGACCGSGARSSPSRSRRGRLAELEGFVDEALQGRGPPAASAVRAAGTSHADAPVAEAPVVVPPRPGRDRASWSATDVAVAGAAILVIALSGGRVVLAAQDLIRGRATGSARYSLPGRDDGTARSVLATGRGPRRVTSGG